MYDVNPLGPMMHLKELERQAFAMDRRTKSENSRSPMFYRLGAFLYGLFSLTALRLHWR